MDNYTLYPRLVVSVGLEFLEPVDRGVLVRLGDECSEKGQKLRGELEVDKLCSGESLDSLVTPKVYVLGNGGFLINQTGADYALEVQGEILSRWVALGVSDTFLGIFKSAQVGLVPRIIFEPNGMYPEKGDPLQIGEIGKKRLSKKRVRKLLKSLRMAHQHYWPLDMLVNIVEPCAKKTR